MTDNLSTWQDVRRLADELELQIHLGSMEARDLWHTLEPRVVQLEKTIEHTGEHAGVAVAHELVEVRRALRGLREDLVAHAWGDFAKGW